MKVLSATQIQELDAATIRIEPIAPIDLMERAATCFVQQFVHFYPNPSNHIYVICGLGNNGGDGLAIARILVQSGYRVTVCIAEFSSNKSADFTTNLNRLPKRQELEVCTMKTESELPVFTSEHIVIDALFGTGLNRTLSDSWESLVLKINQEADIVISVDIPSGLMADEYNGGAIIKATRTLTFQIPKLVMLLDDYQKYIGEWTVLDIGLDLSFMQHASSAYDFVDLSMVQKKLIPRNSTDHKGTYGHALLVMGSRGKMGAASLAAEACLRSGCGLLTVQVPGEEATPLQVACPEAMILHDPHQAIISQIAPHDFNIIGIGCGLGESPLTLEALKAFLIDYSHAMVLDADALNLISSCPELIDQIPKHSILTPHPKEFERLFGQQGNAFDVLNYQIKMSIKYQIHIVYKGHFTRISSPDGRVFFNSTGNHGMATAGSGDVLTGMLTGLLAQGYSPLNAAILGVFIHGLAGDIAADQIGPHALIARDIIHSIGLAYKTIL